MLRSSIHILIFFLLMILDSTLLNTLTLKLSALLHLPLISLIRLDFFIIFILLTAIREELIKGTLLILCYGILTEYFYPVFINLNLITGLCLFYLAKLINQSFLIREFYGGAPFAAVFVVLHKVALFIAVGGYLGKHLPTAEILTALIPLAALNGVVAPFIFTAFERLEIMIFGTPYDSLRRPQRA